jgi:DNA polymerase-1
VNVPKAEDGVLLGKEFRGLYKPFPGHVLVGFDAAALENRVEAHYCYKFSGGPEYADEVLNGDPHTKNAFVFYPEKLSTMGLSFSPEVKENPQFKPLRSKAKAGKYCLSYGGSPPKLAQTLGLPASDGDELYEAFWNANLPLKSLKEKLETFWETTGEKKWIKGIDGRKLYSRSKHSLVNLLFQSCGAIVMDYACIFLDKWLGGIKVDVDGTPGYLYHGKWAYRVIFVHDELQVSCDPAIADEVGQLGVKAIRKAGEYLKMRVPMEGEYKIGESWRTTH